MIGLAVLINRCDKESKRVKTSDNEQERITTSKNELLRVIISAELRFFSNKSGAYH